MARYVYRPEHPAADENGMVDADIAGPRFSGGAATYVISDEMPPTRHMADMKTYTSKAKFREATRAHGCIEVGNEVKALTQPRKPIQLDRGQRRENIRQAIHMLRNGYRP